MRNGKNYAISREKTGKIREILEPTILPYVPYKSINTLPKYFGVFFHAFMFHTESTLTEIFMLRCITRYREKKENPFFKLIRNLVFCPSLPNIFPEVHVFFMS